MHAVGTELVGIRFLRASKGRRLGLLTFARGRRSRSRWRRCFCCLFAWGCSVQWLVVEDQEVAAGAATAKPLPELIQPFVLGESHLSVQTYEDLVLMGVAKLGLEEFLQPSDRHRARAAQELPHEPQRLLALRVQDQAKLKFLFISLISMLPRRAGVSGVAQICGAPRATGLLLHGGSFFDGLGERAGIVLVDDAVDHLVLRLFELVHVGIYLLDEFVKRRVLPQVSPRRAAGPARWAFLPPHAQR
mmetsp:Transcript_13394/g.26247  ORF Transcript_13394/g.26247 Transcript_13394/m.26247 type:complete len:246 (+) Transcript_13394:264-1001(+)